MTDTVSREKRSEIMSKIHSPTKLEAKVHNWLKAKHIRHRMYPKVEGRPDVEVENGGDPFYVFIDGCFWHCCPTHYRRPKSRQEFWVPHVEGSNARREERRRKLSYRWMRLWEHDVNDGSFKEKILKSLSVDMKVLDLFSGLGGWSKAFKERGHSVITCDISSAFKPDWVRDVMTIKPEEVKNFDLILASPPCECFSVMRIGKNWTPDNRPRNEEAQKALELALYTFNLVSNNNYVIENPRAKLRRLTPMPPTATIWYCQYGERRAKPTDIWTNLPLKFRPPCHNGAKDHDPAPRGCNRGGTMDKDTSPAERAMIPYQLSLDVCLQVEALLNQKEAPEIGVR